MAVRFDAATDRLTYVPGSTGNPPDSFTAALWVYCTTDLNNYTSLYRRYTTAGTSRGQLGTDSDGTTIMWWPAGVSFNYSITPGQWTRIALVVSGTTVTTYAGGPTGALTTNSGSAGTVAGANNITLAGVSAGSGSEWLGGRLRNVRTWSLALTAPQIVAEFSSWNPVVTSGLWSDWALPNASDLSDHSGNLRHLAAGSTPVTTEDDPPIPSFYGARLYTGSAWADSGQPKIYSGSAWVSTANVRVV